MAKKKVSKKRAENYEKPLAIAGTFSSVKDKNHNGYRKNNAHQNKVPSNESDSNIKL